MSENPKFQMHQSDAQRAQAAATLASGHAPPWKAAYRRGELPGCRLIGSPPPQPAWLAKPAARPKPAARRKPRPKPAAKRPAKREKGLQQFIKLPASFFATAPKPMQRREPLERFIKIRGWRN